MRRRRRTGFTLLELVTVMIAATVLLVSLGATVILSTQLLEAPPEDSQQWHDREIADRLEADLRYATAIDETHTRGFGITKPNAVSGTSQTAVYEAYIDGLTRQIDSGPVIGLDADAPGQQFNVDRYTPPASVASSNVVRVRSSSSASTSWNSNRLGIDLPPGCKDGDLLIWVIAARTPWFLIVPSDWNYVDFLYPGSLRMRVMYKTYSASSPGPVAVSSFPAAGMSAAIVAIENADPANPIRWFGSATGTASAANAGTHPAPLEPSSFELNQLNIQFFAAVGDPWYDGGLGMSSFTDVLQDTAAAGSLTYSNSVAITVRTGPAPDLTATPRDALKFRGLGPGGNPIGSGAVNQSVKSQRSRSGLTLLEVIVSLILVSTLVLVSITASANLLRNKTVMMDALAGRELAFQILDEVTAVDFQDSDNDRIFGRESSETATNRTDYDDVDDYNGYSCAPPTHRDGTAIAGLAGWSLSVSVSRGEPARSGIVASNDDAAPLRLVTVTCTSAGGATTAESMLVSVVPNNMPAGSSYEKWRRLTLTFPDQRKIEVTAPLRNQPQPSPAY